MSANETQPYRFDTVLGTKHGRTSVGPVPACPVCAARMDWLHEQANAEEARLAWLRAFRVQHGVDFDMVAQ